MKSLILYLALCGIAAGQLTPTFKYVGSNGEQIVNPAFLNAALPTQTGNTGKYLQTNGTLASWVTATGGNLTSGPVTSSSGVSAIADAALTIAKTSGLQTALDAKAPIASPTFTGVVTGASFVGPLTGNADTVTSIGNLNGVVTSTNRTTSIANGAITNAMLATDPLSRANHIGTQAAGTITGLGSLALQSSITSSQVSDATTDGSTNPGKLLKTAAGILEVSSLRLTNPNGIDSAFFRSQNVTGAPYYDLPSGNGYLALTPNSSGTLDATQLTTGTVNLARLVNTQTVGDANATITAGTRDVLLTAITAARTYTLPLASAYPAGSRVSFVDMANVLTSTNTATLARSGSDLINGATSYVLSTPGAAPLLISDGVSRWNMDIRGVPRGGSGVTSITGIIKGNGTAPYTPAIPGTDYVVPSGNITGTSGSVSLSGGGTITGASGAITVAASGTNQNVVMNGSGIASVVPAYWSFNGGSLYAFASASNAASRSFNTAFLGFDGNLAGLYLASNMGIGWASATNLSGFGKDTGIYRGVAGQVLIGTGGTTSFGGSVKTTTGEFVGTLSVTGTSTLTGGLVLPTSITPASASASGVVGTVAWDASFIYVCTATNTWKRVAIATW